MSPPRAPLKKRLLGNKTDPNGAALCAAPSDAPPQRDRFMRPCRACPSALPTCTPPMRRAHTRRAPQPTAQHARTPPSPEHCARAHAAPARAPTRRTLPPRGSSMSTPSRSCTRGPPSPARHPLICPFLPSSSSSINCFFLSNYTSKSPAVAVEDEHADASRSTAAHAPAPAAAAAAPAQRSVTQPAASERAPTNSLLHTKLLRAPRSQTRHVPYSYRPYSLTDSYRLCHPLRYI